MIRLGRWLGVLLFGSRDSTSPWHWCLGIAVWTALALAVVVLLGR